MDHGVVEKLGVPPEDVVDLKALTGDSSDNIPGVRGVGPKTAITLLQAHGSLDGIYAALDAQKGSLRTKLQDGRESAFRSRHLAAIHRDVPLASPPRLTLGQVKPEELGERLQALELFSLLRQTDRFASTFSSGSISSSGSSGDGEPPPSVGAQEPAGQDPAPDLPTVVS
ncbi:MAG: 5'-3' exonuclease H3TH domain-containing protein, partial [Cyanobium sp.]